MNNIKKKGVNPCSSCGLCVLACSQKAILFEHNKNGFYEPNVVSKKCNDCGICTKVCYKYLPNKEVFENTFRDKSIFAAWSKDKESILKSSSGGVGYELTAYFQKKGYQVCGCIFDAPNDACKHIIAETSEDLDAIRSSKYLQSFTPEAFSKFEKDKKYLVIGTPCQIFGLRKYIQLKKWEDNFILVDFFCHGTPTFNLWKKYKEFLSKNHGIGDTLKNVNFREKNLESKWHSYAISIQDSSGKKFVQKRASAEDLFFNLFLNKSCLNEACYKCKLRLDYCEADIRIADFWGKKYAENENGVTLIALNTERGKEVWSETEHLFEVEKCTFEDLKNSQPVRFLDIPIKRNAVLKRLKKTMLLNEIYDNYKKPPFIEKFYWALRRKLNKL